MEHEFPHSEGSANPGMPARIWRVAYPLLIFFGVQLAGGIVLALIFILTRMLPALRQGIGMDVLSAELVTFSLDNALAATLVCDLALIPLFVFLYLRQVKGRRAPKLSSFRPADYLMVAALAVSANFAISGVIEGFRLIDYFPDYQRIESMTAGGSLALQIAAVGIVAPVTEELLMRGLVFGRLRGFLSTVPALLVQALLFGLIHMNLLQGAYAAILGLMLGFLLVRYGSLLMCILFHIVLNMLSVVLPAVLPADFGAGISTWAVLGVSAAATAAILVLIGRRKIPQREPEAT